MKHIAIVGATSVIAQHCAHRWLEIAPAEITLVGRNLERLQRVANDLQVRSPESTIRVRTADFLKPASIQATADAICNPQHKLDLVLIAQGTLPKQARCQDDLAICQQALEINAVSPALYAEAFARHMHQVDHGTIILLGSVAGDRGRKSNYTYGAAKGLLERYAQGMQHRFAGTGVHVLLVKPGPTRTPMTSQLQDDLPKLAEPEQVARQIVRAVSAKKHTLYTPGKWRLIMGVIKLIPRIIFNKLDL